MKYVAALFLTATFFDASSANATFFTGNKLHELCQSSPLVAAGYVMGITDFNGVNLNAIDQNGNSVQSKQFICIARDVSGQQATDVVCKYLADHPKDRNSPAPILVYSALLDAWPCS